MLLAGCAETPQERAARIEPMLSAAGFQMLPADTPQRIAETQRLTPLKVRYYLDNGKPRYWFNDPVNCHCVYVGGQKNYQQYEQIRLEIRPRKSRRKRRRSTRRQPSRKR